MITLLALLACPPKLPTDPLATPNNPTNPVTTPTNPTTNPTANPTDPVALPTVTTTPTEPTPSATGPSPLDLAINDAAILLKTQNVNNAQTALSKLQTLARENPSNADIQYNIGLAYYYLGQTAEARDSWVRTTSIDPAYVKAWLNLGGLSARDGKMDIALLNYQSGISHAPNDMDLRAAQIGALRELKRTDEAIAEAKKALAINSNALPVYTNLALVYLDTDKVDLALFVVDKARQDIKNADESPQVHAIMGQIYYRLGYVPNAVQEFKRSLEIDPNQMAALMFMSGYYLDNRDYLAAVPLLERAAGINPASAGVQLNLGIAYRGLDRKEDAKRCYDRALELDPRNPEPHRNLAILYGDHMHSLDAALEEIALYRKAGGGPAAELDAWVAAIEKEKARKAKEEARKKKEEERARKEAEEARKAAEDAARNAVPPIVPQDGPPPIMPDGPAPQPFPGQPFPPQPDPNQPVQPQPVQPQPVQPQPVQPDPSQPTQPQPVQPQPDPSQPAQPFPPNPTPPAPVQPPPADPNAPAPADPNAPWGAPAPQPTPPTEPSPWGGGQ